MNLLQTYLSELHAVRVTGAGVKETSYYPAVSNAFNALGKTLKPPVRCIINLKNQGAGLPDGGLFTPDQFARAQEAGVLPSLLPSRGVMEVKGTGEEVAQIAASAQVQKYWAKYRQVLVTNLRDFVLVGQDASGQKTTLERFSLAASEAAFWALAANPTAVPDGLAERFSEYLKRVLLHAAPLATPQDVAWFLASYARDARSRIGEGDLPALESVRTALEEALGLKFEGEKGEHFFRSTLIQTLFYGIFSAWVLWSRLPEAQEPQARFSWKEAAYYLHVPMIQTLFEEVAKASHLHALGLVEVLDWTGATLNRVDRAAFFANFDQGHAVQYFYEPFLQAFDPELRKDLGVWYTPPEIVQYMVARVDTALREELGLADGLADPNVYVLDPCCGTGAYLVEVLKRIAETLDAQGGDALGGNDLKTAAMERVFGFEILPAPYVVAHLQLGLLLQNAGVPLAPASGGQAAERAGIFLTNALTGWEPPSEQAKAQLAQLALSYPDLKKEYDAAGQVKHSKKILVILGNPPYNSFAGVGMAEERALSNAYRTTKKAPSPQGQGLNDLYVRFFRMAERCITEATGQGIVCFISNYSWLDGLSHTGMRERFSEVFNDVWIDNLHGDRIISEYAPDGRTSETVFAMEGTSGGIKIGTAISLMIKKGAGQELCTILYRDMDQARASERRTALLDTLNTADYKNHYRALTPIARIGLPFKPRLLNDAYLSWPLLPHIIPVSFPGVKTSRDNVVVDIDKDRLERRMLQYFDSTITHEQMRQLAPDAMENSARYDAIAVRNHLLKRGLLPQNIVRYCYRPFDTRWLYWEPETKFLDEKRADYFSLVNATNCWIVTQQKPRREWSLPQVIRNIGCIDLMDRSASCFPLWLNPKSANTLFSDEGRASIEPQPNLTEAARTYLKIVEASPEEFFYHIIALLHASTYQDENAGALRQDWPRIPLPADAERLHASAALGRQVAALLDTETPVPGVTQGTLRPELRALGSIERVGGGALNPAGGDLRVAAGWGHGGKEGVTMPGKGRSIPRDSTPSETAALDAGAAALGLSSNALRACLGETTWDIYLSGIAYWRNVPARVWDYTIGGYQVMKKWLSYREFGVLGRDLTPDEAREVTHTARRLAALRLLEPALDANYQAVKATCYTWVLG